MQSVHSQQVGSKTSSKSGNWKIVLSDPNLDQFNFGRTLTDKYITTDIISPFGQKSILYNTVSNQEENFVIVSLNFQDIDQTNISSLSFKASEAFFQSWKVILLDNRTNTEIRLTEDKVLPVEPAIELNRLANMGFLDGMIQKGESFFELHLHRKA